MKDTTHQSRSAAVAQKPTRQTVYIRPFDKVRRKQIALWGRLAVRFERCYAAVPEV